MSNEKEFAKAYVKDGQRLQNLAAKAESALTEAKALAEETGLPFETALGIFVPESFKDKFYNIDPDFVETLTDINSYDLSDEIGWRSSSANC